MLSYIQRVQNGNESDCSTGSESSSVASRTFTMWFSSSIVWWNRIVPGSDLHQIFIWVANKDLLGVEVEVI